MKLLVVLFMVVLVNGDPIPLPPSIQLDSPHGASLVEGIKPAETEVAVGSIRERRRAQFGYTTKRPWYQVKEVTCSFEFTKGGGKVCLTIKFRRRRDVRVETGCKIYDGPNGERLCVTQIENEVDIDSIQKDNLSNIKCDAFIGIDGDHLCIPMGRK